jgi:hypothetical protein
MSEKMTTVANGLSAVLFGADDRRLRATWRFLLAWPLLPLVGALVGTVMPALGLTGMIQGGPLQGLVFPGILLVWVRYVDRRSLSAYGVSPSVEGPADFSGLECRWDHVPSHREEIVALLVQATGASLQDDARIYDNVIGTLHKIYGDDDSRPVLHGQLRLAFAPDKLSTEQRVRTHGQGWWRRVLYWPVLWMQNALGRLFMAMDWTTDETQWGNYKEDLEAHTDYRKMDGTLREVLAGTVDQRETFEAYLQEQYEAGNLVYGLDASDAAMVTCLVFKHEKEHVHFVDGADGGYAHAAQDLKERERRRGASG